MKVHGKKKTKSRMKKKNAAEEVKTAAVSAFSPYKIELQEKTQTVVKQEKSNTAQKLILPLADIEQALTPRNANHSLNPTPINYSARP